MLLAINTAFMTANLGIETAKGDVLLKELDAKSKHSENVLKTIDEMCQESNTDINDIESLAVVVGPGSFTGLRIGTAIAQALGCANKKLKFIKLTSLELMAYIIVKNKLNSEDFVCVINALSNLFFVCHFDKNGIKLSAEEIIDKQAFESLKQEKFALNGDVQAEGINYIEITSESLFEFSKSKEIAKEFVTQSEMLPIYLRLSQAEDNLLKKSKKD
ncbi:MAG: tRNA (adenosine(37)-N6)-threonylcarbamoyltransferase complex dimerization subunit type 1 TsaB [Clostridiales bacterium]|nr:tRNA (adenosine(37)-N6)-threonylcarbamoyltransferase complex dimerization subunit type 1 TsaB [Clostridiales bacterium]